jgi:PTH2 family peptidyl-tRNA hydrolase
MVIVIRSDLKMTKGQLASHIAQVAAEAVYNAKRKNIGWVKDWLNEGQKKVVVQVSSEETILSLCNKAKSENLLCHSISTTNLEGKIESGTLAVAIGPAPNAKIDYLTNDLKLL